MAPFNTSHRKHTHITNPFQIRYDVLNMAKDMLDKAYENQMSLAHQMMEMHKENSEQLAEAYQKYIPKAITPEEIKAQAEKLYEFVSEKK